MSQFNDLTMCRFESNGHNASDHWIWCNVPTYVRTMNWKCVYRRARALTVHSYTRNSNNQIEKSVVICCLNADQDQTGAHTSEWRTLPVLVAERA